MFENPRRGRQARNFATNVSKILDLNSSSEQIFFRRLSLGAPDIERIFSLWLVFATETKTLEFSGSQKKKKKKKKMERSLPL